jgi:hypothetical protein
VIKPWLFLPILLVSIALHAEEYDEDLAESLKIEANHNNERLRSFKAEELNNKIFDEEREKGLAEFLEDQEKWDLIRERGLQEYRQQKNNNSTPKEGGPEYQEYLEEKESQDARYERSRQIHVRTREMVKRNVDPNLAKIENEELGLNNERPRYDLRKRSRNKWVNGGSRGSGGFSGSGSSGSSAYDNNIPPSNEFVPAPEFPPAPPAFDAGDDFTPAPAFDPTTGMPLDGGAVPPPEINIPPPPPPTDFDF